MKLSVIGLGKLGACTAACFAYKGFDTIGVDISKEFVKAINDGKAPVYEPGLQELISGARDKLTATMDYQMAISESDITFLIVPTPSREDGHFSNAYLEESLTDVAHALRKSKKKYHLLVITSTVSPGTLENDLIPLVESVSKRKLNEGFGVCYNPEFIALGTVIRDFLNPDMVLIGESDIRAGDQLANLYDKVCDSQPYIARMSLPSAEVTKISLNSYVTMKISFANTLSNICEKIPGTNIDDITAALGADKRISPYYLKGGLSYGGPCFPRDNKAFSAFAADLGLDAKLAKATDAVNGTQVELIVEKILRHLQPHGKRTVSILGLSYKPNTLVIEESPSIKIIESLLRIGDLVIEVYDPLAMDNTRAYFGEKIRYSASVKDCFQASPVCVVATQDKAFQQIRAGWEKFNPTTVIDCWRTLDRSSLGEHIQYVSLGIINKDTSSTVATPLRLVQNHKKTKGVSNG